MNERRDRAKVFEHAWKERREIQECELDKLKSLQSQEVAMLVEYEAKPRKVVLKDEAAARQKLLRGFSKTYVRLPYQEYLDHQDVKREPCAFLLDTQPTGSSHRLPAHPIRTLEMSPDTSLALCTSVGTKRRAQMRPTPALAATVPARRPYPPPLDDSLTASRNPRPLTASRSPNASSGMWKASTLPTVAPTADIAAFPVPHPPSRLAKLSNRAISGRRRGHSQRPSHKLKAGEYRKRIASALFTGTVGTLDPEADLPPGSDDEPASPSPLKPVKPLVGVGGASPRPGTSSSRGSSNRNMSLAMSVYSQPVRDGTTSPRHRSIAHMSWSQQSHGKRVPRVQVASPAPPSPRSAAGGVT
eukprot:NODE_1848_length_1199_cov_42.972015_g1832_i0.p1 GENE.NODE_1848_length_1199_cov_42.972015_g1832_i0~~NODE_1848_length_1199_cov_42.972015_g1832_i0.p1  ORF type:complete len:374 (-),score=56.73 NODE_1848_length_1199_cov_42.972015_g1832_i0:76-1149(-)